MPHVPAVPAIKLFVCMHLMLLMARTIETLREDMFALVCYNCAAACAYRCPLAPPLPLPAPPMPPMKFRALMMVSNEIVR